MAQYGDYRKFDSEPTKEQIVSATSALLGDLIDGLKEMGKEIYDCKVNSIVVVPKKNGEQYTVGVKLAIEE